jgi:uncharacterized protein
VTNEPHSAVHSSYHSRSLDLTNSENEWARASTKETVDEYDRILSYPERHDIDINIDLGKRARDVIRKANEIEPADYTQLLLVRGVGRATLRSLAFVSSLIYDKELAYRDPVMYAYNLGGKDRIPFEINRKTYDSVVSSMQRIIENARIENGEKYKALKRLNSSITG